MLLGPVIEPACPELHHHQRHVRLEDVSHVSEHQVSMFQLLEVGRHQHCNIQAVKVKVNVQVNVRVNVKVKVHTLDIAPLRSESPPQKRSGMARVLKGFRSFTGTPTRSSAIGMSQTCLCLPSHSRYSFTDPQWMEG